MRCPYCAAENIPGDDICSNCGADLAGLDLPEAQSAFSGRLLGDRIGDLRLSPPIVVDHDATVREAVERMREERSGCVFIERQGEPLGLFNERAPPTDPGAPSRPGSGQDAGLGGDEHGSRPSRSRRPTGVRRPLYGEQGLPTSARGR